jgi:hypothetical protein
MSWEKKIKPNLEILEYFLKNSKPYLRKVTKVIKYIMFKTICSLKSQYPHNIGLEPMVFLLLFFLQ